MEGTSDLRVATPSSTAYQRRWWALLVLCLSLVVLGMDNTILNVTLPTLARDLGATASQLQWMVDAYILVFAGLLLTMGALGDRFGRKLTLNAGLLVFMAGSGASAFAGSPEVLIAARAAMGIGAALIMPSTLSIITNIFPPTERGRAIGVWTGMAGLGIVLGPVVGGWLLEGFWWGSVFLVNLPVVALTIGAGWPLVPESRDPNATPLDPIGAALSVAALVMLVYGIIQAPEDGWSDPRILAAFGVAAVLSVAFIWWERRLQHPMLRTEFFRNPRFSAASGAIAMAFFALFGSVFLLTQHLQFVLGYTPLQAGVRILPVATLVVAAPLAARLAERLGTKLVVAAGLLIVASSLWLLSTVEIGDGYGRVAAMLALLGIGMGFTMAPATESIMGSLPPAKAGVGSAMNDTTRQVGGALGVAVLGSILAAGYGAAIEPALRDAPPPIAQTAGDSIGAAATIAVQAGPHGQGLLEAARSAFIHGMGDAVQVGAGVAALAALLVLLFLPARGKEEAPVGDGVVEVEAARTDGQGPLNEQAIEEARRAGCTSSPSREGPPPRRRPSGGSGPTCPTAPVGTMHSSASPWRARSNPAPPGS
jgi:EmrB/QacA subfamily drug resistance transporter